MLTYRCTGTVLNLLVYKSSAKLLALFHLYTKQSVTQNTHTNKLVHKKKRKKKLQ